MLSASVLKTLEQTLSQCSEFNYNDGFTKQQIERLKAILSMQSTGQANRFTSELKTITHLINSHAPSLNCKISIDYQTKVGFDESKLCLNGENVQEFTAIDAIRQKLEEMPEEWTFVQLTPHFDVSEHVQFHNDKFSTSGLHISVFQCGANQPKAFCVNVDKPIDKLNGQPVHLRQEVEDIIEANKNSFKSFADKSDRFAKQRYWTKRETISARMKSLVHELEKIYLKEWRCLFAGKLIDKSLERRLAKLIVSALEGLVLTKREVRILMCLLKNFHHLQITDVRRILIHLFPELAKKREDLVRINKSLTRIHEQLDLRVAKKHSLILIVDETLDSFPWEMMNVVQNEPVTRVPSLHVAYALFKEHETTVRNGFKEIRNPHNGNYIVNPGVDLPLMGKRIATFIKYWLSGWQGISGVTPSETEFKKLLTTCEIFSYHGHGSGAQYLHPTKVRKLRVHAAVLLFGCSSIRSMRKSPRVAMEGSYQMYLIACSPCMVGMLWEVSDLDTDILTTEFLSSWIANEDVKSWAHVNKYKWNQGKEALNHQDKENTSDVQIIEESRHKPELLEALNAAKKSQAVRNYLTKAACVARGIPAKIIHS